MKKFLSILLSAVMVASACFASHKAELDKTQKSQHKAMHEIVMIAGKDAALCTAYAIDNHVLLTAEHCNLPTDYVLVDNIGIISHDTADRSIFAHKIVARFFDKNDHMLLVVPSENFKDVITYDPATYKAPQQGEHAYSWGNPGGERDMYREGYMMGMLTSVLGVGQGPIYLFNWFAIGGDSGSAIFSAVDHRLIAVVTYTIADGHMMGAYALQFTEEEVQQAESMK